MQRSIGGCEMIFHEEEIVCPICTQERDLFVAIHHRGSPCYICGVDMKWIGLDELFCAECKRREMVDRGM